MIDLHLRATNEATLAAALPWLRATGDDGAQVRLEASEHHAFVPNVLIVTTPAVADAAGGITTPAVIADGWFANLRLFEGHPDRTLILEACAPFSQEAGTPQQTFATGEPQPVPVPAVIFDRQFAQVLAIDGIITEAEALAWAARGDLPEALETTVDHLPEAHRFSARMLLAAATTYERAHPLVAVLRAILGRDAGDLDDIWRRGAAL